MNKLTSYQGGHFNGFLIQSTSALVRKMAFHVLCNLINLLYISKHKACQVLERVQLITEIGKNNYTLNDINYTRHISPFYVP